ncbi:hypothetical protein HYS72_01575 [Candidatus Pacearchaeota archaeon]|nr:hypothetical protein [Candidatus Pacearchaeota archaeon]MBI2057330.1 hypothetical protein [Candidatus Pacearchaeota archaeon]
MRTFPFIQNFSFERKRGRVKDEQKIGNFLTNSPKRGRVKDEQKIGNFLTNSPKRGRVKGKYILT